MKRRDAIISFSAAPLAAMLPSNGLASSGLAQNLSAPPALFIYDAALPDARALAAAAAQMGHRPHAIESDEKGFWRAKEPLALKTQSLIFGATTRRVYFVFEQLSRLHWSHRLNDARILEDGADFSFWTLRFHPAQ